MRNEHFENENLLNKAIHRLARNLRRNTPNTPRTSHGYFHLLSLINEHDGSSSSELAELMDIRPSSLTQMLGYLESDELILRSRDDNDMRIIRVFIKEAGRKHLENLGEKNNDNYLDILSSEEADKLLELCNKLSQGLIDRNPGCEEDEHHHKHHDFSGHHNHVEHEKNHPSPEHRHHRHAEDIL